MKKDIIINNINSYIKIKGIKQNWIAEMLDTNKMTINNILNFKTKKIDLDTIESIANALDLTIEELADENFQVKEDTFDNIDNNEPLITLCESVDIKEKETLNALLGIINIIDTVKTANENMESYS